MGECKDSKGAMNTIKMIPSVWGLQPCVGALASESAASVLRRQHYLAAWCFFAALAAFDSLRSVATL